MSSLVPVDFDPFAALPAGALPLGIRGNNPGNLRDTPTPWQGAIGSNKGFEVFDTPESGIRAMARNLHTYGTRGINTVQGVVEKWSPSNAPENRDPKFSTASYIANVAKELGIAPDAPIDLNNPAVLQKLTTAMIRHENGQVPYQPEQIARGVHGALGGMGAGAGPVARQPQPAPQRPAVAAPSGSLVPVDFDPFAVPAPSPAVPAATAAPQPSPAPSPSPASPAAGGDVRAALAYTAGPLGPLAQIASTVLGPQEGAPSHVRAAVGAMPEENRQSALSRFYPTNIDMGNGNFMYQDENGAWRSYNPSGLDPGDIASLPADIAELAGGIGGGLLGVAGGPPGVIAGGAAGATGARELVQRATMGALGIDDARTPLEQATDVGTTAALNAAGPALTSGVSAGARGLARATFRGGSRGRQRVGEAIDDMARFGVSPSVAQATQNPLMDAVESALSRYPGGAGVIRTRARQAAQTVADAIERRTGSRALDPTSVGIGITRDVNAFANTVFRDRADTLYGAVDRWIKPDDAVRVSNTSATLARLTQPVAGATHTTELLINPTLRNMSKAFTVDAAAHYPASLQWLQQFAHTGQAGVPQGTIPYSTLRNLRSFIGRRLASRSLTDDIPAAELKQVYGALSEDLRAAATSRGKDALRAFNRADQYYRSGISRIDNILEPLIQKDVPEKVFTALEKSGKDGATLLWQTRRSVTPEQWGAVSNLAMRRMGRATASAQDASGDVFSFNTFLTNWNKMDARAKDALFSNQGTLRADLDALARSAGRMRESSRAFYNTSGTAGATNLQNYINAGLASAATAPLFGKASLVIPATLALGAVGSNAAARLMTSPRFVRWLSRSTRVQPNAWSGQIGRLMAVAGDDNVREDLKAYLNELTRITSGPEPPQADYATPEQKADLARAQGMGP